jgi:hypothetical protein
MARAFEPTAGLRNQGRMKPLVLALLAAAMVAGVICALGLILFAFADPAVECGSLARGVDKQTGPPGIESPLRLAAAREMDAGPGA